MLSLFTGFEGGGGGAFTGLGGPTEVAVGLGPGTGGGLEEPMNFTDIGGVLLFFWAVVAPKDEICSTSLVESGA